MTSKVYNPFSKAYWTKANLFASKAELAEIKAGFNKDMSQASVDFKEGKANFTEGLGNLKVEYKANADKMQVHKLKSTNKKLMSMAIKSVFLITIPVLLSIFFGLIGMVLGAIIFFITLLTIIKK